MPRKFWTPYTALVANYSNNERVCQFTYLLGTWNEGSVITTELPGNNLISMSIGAATIGNSRCLKTAYGNGAVIPFSCINGVWSSASGVAVPGAGNPASIGVSLDGIHALCGGDYMSGVGALKFDTGTGLWAGNGLATIPESHTDSVAISPNGLLGMCLTKWGSNAYPLYRDPDTDVWTAGEAIPLGFAGTKFYCLSFNPDSNICLIGSNIDGVNGKAAFWDGSAWTLVTVPAVFAASRWLADGTTIIATSGNCSGRYVLILKYDPDTTTFSLAQTITISGGGGDVWGPSVPELGRQDIALVVLFYGNQILPLSNTGGVWSAGTPISSPNFAFPAASVIMPIV